MLPIQQSLSNINRKPEVSEYICNNTDMLEKLISGLMHFYFEGALEKKEYGLEEEVIAAGILNTETSTIKTFKKIIPNINYYDFKRNVELMRHFGTLFREIERKRSEEYNNYWFTAIPIHRLFAYYLTKLAITQTILKKKENPNLSDAEALKLSVSQFFESEEEC